MILDILIKINKRKLNLMVQNHTEYEKILKQSQKLDKYISKKTIEIIEKYQSKS